MQILNWLVWKIPKITHWFIANNAVHKRKQMKAVLYVHGKGGNASESTHYEKLFPNCKVIGLDYKTFSPWETGKEIHEAVVSLKAEAESIILVASSIGAFFSMNANLNGLIEKAYFISPVVNMEKLICDMMKWANVTESELEQRKIIPTDFGEELSWEYLCYVRVHPLNWQVPTSILYGENDNLTSIETMSEFAEKFGATLTVMKGGEHWFHTEEEMNFLVEWIRSQK